MIRDVIIVENFYAQPLRLRQLALDADGSKLYVAAPNREGYGAPDPAFPNSHILVLNIDPADKPADGKPNTEKYWELIGSVETHQETYGVTVQPDFKGTGELIVSMSKAGVAGDLFLSADSTTMEEAIQAGIIEETIPIAAIRPVAS